jgi:hypothetical protein
VTTRLTQGGVLPHPERTRNGDVIFQSLRDYIAKRRDIEPTIPLYYYPRSQPLPRYQKPNENTEYIVELMITDNHALTVQNTLHQLGLPVKVKRWLHWEIKSSVELQAIKKSGVLFNERKEIEVHPDELKRAEALTFLVRAKDDLTGQQKRQTLQDHFSLHAIDAIYSGVLWQFSSDTVNVAELKSQLLKTNIIFNPYSHDCFSW